MFLAIIKEFAFDNKLVGNHPPVSLGSDLKSENLDCGSRVEIEKDLMRDW